MAKTVSDIPIPKRMRKLPRDRRGYPIPASVYRDETGRPHFQITDQRQLAKMLKFDLCPICGSALKGNRWFVGGPRSAFSVLGAYSDPPMHDECAHYALQVCPFLAAPTYTKRIEDRTIKDKENNIITVDERVAVERPALFVAVEVAGHTVRGQLTVPDFPFLKTEYWLHGTQLSQAEGEAMCKTTEGVMPQ